MTNNFLSELSGACAILILSSRLLYALRRFFASFPKPHSQLQTPTDDQRRLAEWYSSRTRASDDGLRLCLDCPPRSNGGVPLPTQVRTPLLRPPRPSNMPLLRYLLPRQSRRRSAHPSPPSPAMGNLLGFEKVVVGDGMSQAPLSSKARSICESL